MAQDADAALQFRYASGFVGAGNRYTEAVCLSDPDGDGMSTGLAIPPATELH